MEENVEKLVSQEVERQIEAKIQDFLVSRNVAAKLLKVDKSTLWRWEKNRYLIPVRIGKKVFYSATVLRAKFGLTTLTLFKGE